MTTTVINPAMTGQEIVDLTKKHTLFEWSAQSKVDPIPVAKAKGIYFWTPEGKRFIDFNSQLMSVNIGHGDERVINAIHEQAQTLCYANPFMATEPRARLGDARDGRRALEGKRRDVGGCAPPRRALARAPPCPEDLRGQRGRGRVDRPSSGPVRRSRRCSDRRPRLADRDDYSKEGHKGLCNRLLQSP